MTLFTSNVINGLNTEPNLGSWRQTATFSTATQTTALDSVFFKPDGLQMYLLSYGGSTMWQYTLSVAWDITTATITRTGALSSWPSGLWFKPDGTKMYTSQYNNAFGGNIIREYNLSVAWDISTLAFLQSYTVAEDIYMEGLSLNPSGTTMWVIGDNTGKIYQYTLSTAWNITTATYASKSLTLTATENSYGLFVDPTSTYAYTTGNNSDTVYLYTMSTPGDISTATLTSQQTIMFNDSNIQGIWVEKTQNKAYLVGDSNNTIIQMNTSLSGFIVSPISQNAQVLGSLDIKDNLTANGKVRILNSLTVGGAGTAGNNQISALAIFASSLSSSGQITSTLGAGTAPFVIGSTTMVTNLNVNYLGGATFANPGPIGGTTKWAGNFTSLTITGSLSANGSIGTAGQSLLSNGTLAYWGTSGVVAAQIKTANYTAVSGDVLACNTITVGAFTVTLPITPAANAKVVIFDAGSSAAVGGFSTNNLTVARNGSTIHGLSEDAVISTKGVSVSFEYIGGTWIVRNNGDLINFTGANVITNRFVSASTTAANYDVIGVNTTSTAVSITLPINPVVPTIVTIYDAGCTATFGGFATNNCTVLRNGSTIHGIADDILLTTKGVSVIFEYNGTTWRMRNGG